MYLTELGWRASYLTFAFLVCLLVGVYYGEFRLILCLEPWTNNWEMETRQYFHPGEVWLAYIKISSLVSLRLLAPGFGVHIMLFLANSLTKEEQKTLVRYWIARWILLWMTWCLLIKNDLIGTLMDISHFDEDVEIVYVPNLNSYVNNWSSLRLRCSITSQLPLVWIYQQSRRYLYTSAIESRSTDREKSEIPHIISQVRRWDKLKSRLIFILTFLLPSTLSALFIFDDVILDILWVIRLRRVYLVILYSILIKAWYHSEL